MVLGAFEKAVVPGAGFPGKRSQAGTALRAVAATTLHVNGAVELSEGSTKHDMHHEIGAIDHIKLESQ